MTFALIAVTTASSIFSVNSYAGAVYYRWLDERGQSVHSDRPPPKGVDYEVVSTGAASVVRPVDGESGAVPKEITPRVGNEFEAVNKKQEIEKNPEYCARARENLSRLDTDARIRMRNDKGEVRYLDEEERAMEREKAIASIEAYCE